MTQSKDNPSTSWYSINKELLPPKILYFTYYAGLICILPFYPVWYQSIGLSASQIGILGALRPFSSLFAAPFFGGLSDKFQIHKGILLFAIAASILGRLCMTLVNNHSFVLLAFFLVFSEFCAGIIIPLLDKIVLDILGEERKELYGRQRLFGAIAAGTASFSVGSFVNWIGNPNFFFYCLAVIMSLFFLIILKFTIDSPKATAPFWKSIGLLVSSVDNFLFFFVVYIVGFGVGIVSNFMFLHLRALGADSRLMGLALTFNCIAEIPCFFFSGILINKITPKGILVLALAAFGIRLGAYSLLTDPWYVLPVELLHGITFGLFWASSVRYAQAISPPGLGATTQGLLAAAYTGLGTSTGGLLGGLLYGSFGAKFLFQISSLVLFVVFIMYCIYLLATKGRSTEGSKYQILTLGNEGDQQEELDVMQCEEDHREEDTKL